MFASARLRAGDWVEIRSKEEILATLDRRGYLDELPFMPEMFSYCGQHLRVSKRAHKTCDPPSGIAGRKMTGAVHLEGIRCDGQGHGGCQAGCLIFWKEAWLKPVQQPTGGSPQQPSRGCTEQDVWSGTLRDAEGESQEPAYVCQSTHLFQATRHLHWWDVRQYIEDFLSGNVRVGQFIAAILYTLYTNVAEAGIGFGTPMRWAYDRFQSWRGGAAYPMRIGRVPAGQQTPKGTLGLAPGEMVRVKSYDEILDTLNRSARNRGLYFDPEHVSFCGRTYPVLKRVERIIDEKSGRMINLKTDAIILQDVVCEARYAKCRRFCPRAIYPYWRETLLERVEAE
jgi:hypothetical protein